MSFSSRSTGRASAPAITSPRQRHLTRRRGRLLVLVLLPLPLLLLLVGGVSLLGVQRAHHAALAYQRLALAHERAARQAPLAVEDLPQWMPLGVLARQYGVPLPVLEQALTDAGFPLAKGQAPRLVSLRQVAGHARRSPQEAAAAVQAAIVAYHQAHPESYHPRPLPPLPPLPPALALTNSTAPAAPAIPTSPAQTAQGDLTPLAAPRAPEPSNGVVSLPITVGIWEAWPWLTVAQGWLAGAGSALAGLSDDLLALLPVYGYTVLAVATVVGALGLPVPLTVLLLAAGALTADDTLGFVPAAGVTLLAAVAGDSAGYLVGRSVGRTLLERVGPRFGLTAPRLVSAERAFGRWGGGSIWITRWLVTPLGPAVNILAGANRLRWTTFVAYDAAGEAMWAVGYLGIGWLFGEHWGAALDLVGSVSGAALPFAVVTVLVGALVMIWRRRQRVTPAAAGQPSLPSRIAAA